MKFSAPVLLACTAALLLAFAGCNYIKPVMYLNVENHSGHPMENLEVKYPTGTFGLPELRDGQTHQHMTPIGSPCTFRITFEDQTGKVYAGTYDFGAKCPAEVAFEVGAGMSVSQRVVRP
jgi:hypothetical protein